MEDWVDLGYPANNGNALAESRTRDLSIGLVWRHTTTPPSHRAFIQIGPVNVPAKFEVRSFTCSWDKMG